MFFDYSFTILCNWSYFVWPNISLIPIKLWFLKNLHLKSPLCIFELWCLKIFNLLIFVNPFIIPKHVSTLLFDPLHTLNCGVEQTDRIRFKGCIKCSIGVLIGLVGLYIFSSLVVFCMLWVCKSWYYISQKLKTLVQPLIWSPV